MTELMLPPHSLDAEQSVIGALLLDNNAYDRIADTLTGSDFYRHDNRLIFEAATAIIGKGQAADMVTVAESLNAHGQLDDAGGIAYLGSLVQNVPSASNIRRYAEIVQKKSITRGLLCVANEITDACLGVDASDPEKIAHNAENAMLRLLDRAGDDPQPLASVFSEAMIYIEQCAERAENGKGPAGLATGFDDLDKITSGLEPGQLVVVAARPAVGKTLFGCNVASHVAEQGKAVLFFSLEMPRREIGLRIISSRAKVSVHTMRAGTREDIHWDSFNKHLAHASNEPLHIDDRASISPAYIRAKAKRIQRQSGLDLIVIDYLGLMKGEGQNRTQEIGSISRALKALAKELQIPIIALAQLNRGVEGRTDKRPMLSDLRDSGEIEQDADMVIMLHREELYSDDPEWHGYAEVLLRKNRNGSTGELALSFRPQEMSFQNYSGVNVRRLMSGRNKFSNVKRGLD